MTFKNNRAPLLSNIKLYVSFHQHMWIQTGVTVRKWLSWVVTSVTLTFDLWPWPFAWTLPWSLVITPENFMMIRWWEHSQKGVTDRRTDGQTDRQTENTIHRAAWSQLKIIVDPIGNIFIASQSFSVHDEFLQFSLLFPFVRIKCYSIGFPEVCCYELFLIYHSQGGRKWVFCLTSSAQDSFS